jgi:hypothetical protein
MAITRQPKTSRSEAFTAEAPDAKPMPKLRGRRQPLALALPPDLLRTIDEFAVQQRRSRANLIEIILDDWVQAQRGKEAA